MSGRNGHGCLLYKLSVVRPPRDLSAISLATRSIAPEGERKRGTVLDCRIANAAAVVERLGPVAARDLTRDLLNVAAEELGRYGGVITERRVDGFVALFGAPVVHEDDGRRAVLAALGIQQRFGRLAALESNQDEPINLRIGLGTGVLVVTRTASYAEVEYAAVGEPIRVADLLQQIASPGMVLIGDTTRRAVDGDIDTVPSGSHEAAGAVFRVVGLLGRHDARSARFARTLAPFVGRHHELAVLGDLASSVRAGKGQAVSIVGDPGIGKSRLLHECTQHVAAPAGMAVLEGRCVSYGSNIPYLPLADFIRTHCGVRESDPPEHMRLAVARTTRDYELPPESGTVGWVEATRRNDAAAVAACQRGLEQAPDRVSRAYASMILGFALIGQDDHDQARTILEPIVAELKGFALPQWHGFATALTAETYRLDARLDVAGTLVERALDLMTRAQYGYGVAFAQRVAARIALDRGAWDEATATFDDASRTFERIGARFEARRTRDERNRVKAP